jgi:hypothetical protein
MVKTLKITTIIAAFLATAFLALSVAFALRPDQEKENFLMKPGAIEKYRKGSAAAVKKTDEISPLMKQAGAFAQRIQPPAPQKPTKPSKPIAQKPSRVTPKFTLIGTAVYVIDPIRSLALIDEPGKGLRWVKQSQSVGHLVIDQINDGNIVIRDGERTETLYAIHPQRKSILKSPPAIGPQRGSKPKRDLEMTKPFDTSMPPPKDSKSIRHRRRPRTITKAPKPDTSEKLPESMGISPEEAEDLGELGTLLQAMEDEILRMERERQNARAGSTPNEPNGQ